MFSGGAIRVLLEMFFVHIYEPFTVDVTSHIMILSSIKLFYLLKSLENRGHVVSIVLNRSYHLSLSINIDGGWVPSQLGRV